MKIHVDDLKGDGIAAFLEEHIRDMRAISPPESKHALDLDGLKKPEITFWTAVENDRIIGCGALKELDKDQAEVKSMRVAAEQRGRGAGSALLVHLIKEGKSRNYRLLYLETGSMDFFKPARKLYEKFGFYYCGPFGTYKEDPNSVFMKKDL
ncbi:MAG: GCN5-related N-acetyltransferase [Rariglobus sp.]|nr:GCN5-related N-acetyltransferase [Rariglobus sp.]